MYAYQLNINPTIDATKMRVMRTVASSSPGWTDDAQEQSLSQVAPKWLVLTPKRRNFARRGLFKSDIWRGKSKVASLSSLFSVKLFFFLPPLSFCNAKDGTLALLMASKCSTTEPHGNLCYKSYIHPHLIQKTTQGESAKLSKAHSLTFEDWARLMN